MAEKKKWVAGWGAAISEIAINHASYIKDQTFRYVIYPSVRGEKLILHFSNEYGDEAVTVTSVNVAKRRSGEYIYPETVTKVTFGGKAALTMGAGETAVSDEIPFVFDAGEEFCISMYFGELTALKTGQSAGGYFIKNYYGKGNWASEEAVPLEEYGENAPYVFLNTVDFLTDDDVHAVVAFGDSITALPWPDCLAHRLVAEGYRNVTVIRKAISGNRVLRDYKYRLKTHFGKAGIKRFERDITQAGADRVIVLEGINDLAHPNPNNRLCGMDELPDSEEMIEKGYRELIGIARRHGMKIFLGTIMPASRCMREGMIQEKTRQEINEWIRTTADCDGVIDFDRALRDPADPGTLYPEYDSGDHVHPSLKGSEKMSDTVPNSFVL
ncbi:MAG: GDSL-type esterase/lipase family protein [Clostridia bacterium]|nr:GDSL-type esterase/lipase family protein [Clostridia bacterium]